VDFFRFSPAKNIQMTINCKPMKKITFLALWLFLPFFMQAQWSFLLTTAGGVASENSVTPATPGSMGPSLSGYSQVGYALQGGFEANYYFACSRLGLGTGIFYSHNRSLQTQEENPFWSIQDEYWHAESIRIPANLFISLGKKHHSVLLFGLAGNFNLRHHDFDPPNLGSITYRDNAFFVGIQTGYKYKWNRFEVGVLFYRDVSWFVKQIIYQDNQGNINMNLIYQHYFHTAQITLSYRLSGGKEKSK
jgi:hypothetical protein